ncbi:MAG TPA: hypothetical protein PLZ11_13720 [Thauera sp.]|nr:hypothetical protein [Thauera sp.]
MTRAADALHRLLFAREELETEELHRRLAECPRCSGAPGQAGPCVFVLALYDEHRPCRCCPSCRQECEHDAGGLEEDDE